MLLSNPNSLYIVSPWKKKEKKKDKKIRSIVLRFTPLSSKGNGMDSNLSSDNNTAVLQ